MDETCTHLAPAIVERGLGLGGEPSAHAESCPRCKKLALATEELVKLASPAPSPAPRDAFDEIMAAAEKRRAHPVSEAPRRVSLACTFCHGPLEREQAVFCTGCLAPHHRECFAEYGKCATLGCGADGFVAPGKVRRRWPLLVALVATGALAGAALQATHRDGAAQRLHAEALEEARAEVAIAEADHERVLAKARADLEAAKVRAEAAREQLAIARESLQSALELWRTGKIDQEAARAVKAKVSALEAEDKLAQLAVDSAAAACSAPAPALDLARKKLERVRAEPGATDRLAATAEVGAESRHRSDLASSRDALLRCRDAERLLRLREVEQAETDVAILAAARDRDTAKANAEVDAAKVRKELASKRKEHAKSERVRLESAKDVVLEQTLAAARVKEAEADADLKLARGAVEVAEAAAAEPPAALDAAKKRLDKAKAVLAALDASYAVRDAALRDEIARIDSTIEELRR